jgi:hypothetical protein
MLEGGAKEGEVPGNPPPAKGKRKGGAKKKVSASPAKGSVEVPTSTIQTEKQRIEASQAL